MRVATEWYVNMLGSGHYTYVDRDELVKSIPGVLAAHWVLGDAEDCAAQLREIGDAVPVNPIITRANWPGMTADESVAYIGKLGEQLIPSLEDYEPVTSLA